MNWSSASEFLAMGGYGMYVWGSYGVAAAAMLIDVAYAAARQRRALADAKREIEDEREEAAR